MYDSTSAITGANVFLEKKDVTYLQEYIPAETSTGIFEKISASIVCPLNDSETSGNSISAIDTLGAFVLSMSVDSSEKEYTPRLFTDEQNLSGSEEINTDESNESQDLFDQDINEEEDFEIPAFLRRQKF